MSAPQAASTHSIELHSNDHRGNNDIPYNLRSLNIPKASEIQLDPDTGKRDLIKAFLSDPANLDAAKQCFVRAKATQPTGSRAHAQESGLTTENSSCVRDENNNCLLSVFSNNVTTMRGHASSSSNNTKGLLRDSRFHAYHSLPILKAGGEYVRSPPPRSPRSPVSSVGTPSEAPTTTSHSTSNAPFPTLPDGATGMPQLFASNVTFRRHGARNTPTARRRSVARLSAPAPDSIAIGGLRNQVFPLSDVDLSSRFRPVAATPTNANKNPIGAGLSRDRRLSSPASLVLPSTVSYYTY